VSLHPGFFLRPPLDLEGQINVSADNAFAYFAAEKECDRIIGGEFSEKNFTPLGIWPGGRSSQIERWFIYVWTLEMG
jgi:hypothetical protein